MRKSCSSDICPTSCQECFVQLPLRSWTVESALLGQIVGFIHSPTLNRGSDGGGPTFSGAGSLLSTVIPASRNSAMSCADAPRPMLFE
eukprot:7598188-Ditylum_brightwellii.AAC.1